MKIVIERAAENNRSQRESRSASEVWVLAASTGGLRAVAQFLARVKPERGLGFVYAQHIEVAHQDQLLKLVSRHSQWGAEIAYSGGRLREGCVTVISPGERISIGGGRIKSTGQCWRGPYRPCIDDICHDLAVCYQQCSGMIVFTGMGDDGVTGSKKIKAARGSVWVQAPESCIAPALPEAIKARGEYDFCADIEVLSSRFNRRLGRYRKGALGQ